MNIIYIRTSTEEQTPELQLRDCEELSKKLKLDYQIIQDKVSGWKEIEREGFDNLVLSIKKNQIENIICWDLDRLYRNRKKLIEFFQLCKIYKCKVHSYRQQWLESLNTIQPPWNEIMFDLMLQIMGWLAEEESTKKSERVKLAMKEENGRIYSKYGKEWGMHSIGEKVCDKETGIKVDNKIVELAKQGLTIRQIRIHPELYYWKDGNKKLVSIGYIHKVLKKQLKGGKNE